MKEFPYKIMVYDWPNDTVLVEAYGNWFLSDPNKLGKFNTGQVELMNRYELQLRQDIGAAGDNARSEYVLIRDEEDEVRWSQFLLEWG